MEKVRFGIIGVGNQGHSYIVNIFEKGLVENGYLTAVCDINPARLDAVKEKLGDKKIGYYDNHIEMLESGLCDAVLIETPHYDHPQLVEDCLTRGVNVICEKPAGVYTKQVRLMNEVAEKSDAKFGMMFNQRTNCLYRKMRELVRSGEIGELQRVTWIITDWFRSQCYYDAGSWRATWDGEGGGVLINQCPHQLDLVQWVVGELPTKVRGFCKYGKWHDIEVEDDVTAYFEYANGATGMFITTTGETPGTNRFEISGTKGKILCENNELILYKNKMDSQEYVKTVQKTFGRPDYDKIVVETDGLNDQHAGIINNFANALLGKEELFVDGREGISGVELMNAIELSGWLDGKEITLPVDEELYLSELNKRRETSRRKETGDAAVSNTANTY